MPSDLKSIFYDDEKNEFGGQCVW